MKKLFLVLTIAVYGLTVPAQTISYQEARTICAKEMAAFTHAVSGAYKKGGTCEQFQNTVCGRWLPTKEGTDQLRVAYNFLAQGVTNDYIIKTYSGREVAAAM